LAGQGAGIQNNAGLNQANFAGQLAGQGAGMLGSAGQQASNMYQNAGQALGGARSQAGRDLASSLDSNSQNLANFQSGQGAGLESILASGGANIQDLIANYGQLNATQQQELARILSNLSVGQGSQAAGAQQAIGSAQSGGIMGRADAISGTTTDIAKLLGMG
jgi:hypothetical protein